MDDTIKKSKNPSEIRTPPDIEVTIISDKGLENYSMAIQALEKSIECLEEAEKYPASPLVQESLLVCAVIHYVRPFSRHEQENNDSAVERLDLEAFSDITEDEIALHDQFKEIRNKLVVQAEWPAIPAGGDPKSPTVSGAGVNILSDQIDWSLLKALAKKLIEQCHRCRADQLYA